MNEEKSRFKREKKTVDVMIGLYCQSHHRSRALCRDCEELRAYARVRLDKCPFKEGKTTCAKCPVHCYQPQMRSRVKEIMRFSGPRMIYRHPMMAIRHLMDGRRKAPLATRLIE